MGKVLFCVTCLNLLCLAIMLPINSAQAADEDLTSSVYLVFDPETGEFVTVDDPNRTLQNHEAQEPAKAADGQSPSSHQTGSPALPLSAGVAIAITLLGAAAVWIQRKKRKLS